jgi:CheY-like chemotaxis protein
MSRILIVDDASNARESLAKVLRMEGYETSIAGCGTDALTRLKETKPDMILLDHMMPEVDGLTFLAGIRRFPKWKELPVIMVSGLKDRQCQMKAHTLGVREYLVKSEFTIDELLVYIQKHLTSKPVGAGF